MISITNNGLHISKNKNYYKHILIKMNKNIISLGVSISVSDNQYKMIIRFYKIYSSKNNLSLEHINEIVADKFPIEIADIIIQKFLENGLSFEAIKEDENNGSHNTVQVTIKLVYSETLKSYVTNIEKISSFIYKDIVDDIASKISDNFESYLNNKTYFDINDIFNLKKDNKNMDYSYIYRIYNSYKVDNNNIGWGIMFQK